MNKKQLGFTVVELIAVILILSVLAATAIPKFIKLSSEANLNTIKAMGGAILSSANLVYAKSVIQGLHNQASTNIDVDNDGTVDLQIAYGYPNGTRDNGIAKIMAGDFSTGWTWASNAGGTVFWLTTAKLGNRIGPYVNNTAVSASNCYILYTQASSTSGPTVTYVTTGC